MAAAVDTLAVLREVLPGGGADVDEAVLTYMAEMLQDKTMSLDDLRESLGPLLSDSGAVPEGSRRTRGRARGGRPGPAHRTARHLSRNARAHSRDGRVR